MSDAACGFTAGFAARHAAAADLLQAAFSPPPGFAARDPRPRANDDVAPRHFHPADPTRKPTEGWNPLDTNAEPQGFIDPVEVAREEGYQAGVAAATETLQANRARDQALLIDLAAALRAGHQLDRETMAHHLRQTVLFLVTKLVGETGISADLLTARIEAAADLLADAAEASLLHVNPADLPLIEGRLPQSLFAAGDATVARGSFILESASTLVEDGPDLWLNQLGQAIERIPVPPLC
jgi:flagellar assembly protein FliH